MWVHSYRATKHDWESLLRLFRGTIVGERAPNQHTEPPPGFGDGCLQNNFYLFDRMSTPILTATRRDQTISLLNTKLGCISALTLATRLSALAVLSSGFDSSVRMRFILFSKSSSPGSFLRKLRDPRREAGFFLINLTANVSPHKTPRTHSKIAGELSRKR